MSRSTFTYLALYCHVSASLIALPRPDLNRESYAGADETLGAKIWPSAPHMAKHLPILAPLIKGKRVLEIGACTSWMSTDNTQAVALAFLGFYARS